MKFLKGLALFLLGFLLLLSLSIFSLALTLNYTVLNPDFIVSEVDKLDIPSLVEGFFVEETTQAEPYLTEVLGNTIIDLEDWIKEQVDTSIHAGYDYFLGKSESLSLAISLEPMRESMKENLRQAILDSPPPELAGVSSAEIELYLDEAYREIDEVLPEDFEFDESSLSPEVLAQLEQVRQYIGYFQLGYKALIGFILLLLLGIVLIHRQVKGATRGIGSTFLTFGIPMYLGVFAAKYFAGTQLAQFDIPVQFQTLLPQLISDFLAPLQMFCIGLLVAGVALLVVSFVYKPRQPSL